MTQPGPRTCIAVNDRILPDATCAIVNKAMAWSNAVSVDFICRSAYWHGLATTITFARNRLTLPILLEGDLTQAAKATKPNSRGKYVRLPLHKMPVVECDPFSCSWL